MATVNRADTAVNLDQGGAWVGGVAPTSADIATWGSPNITTNVNRNLGASVSWGGIEFLSTQTSAITIGTNAFTLTVGASGINLSASGANLSLTSSTIISLGANQTWSVGSGRTLSLTSVVSSVATNRILTKSGVGTLTLNAANTFGGSGGGLVVNAGLVTGNNNNSFGNAANTVTVASGAAIQVSATAPVQTAWSVSGSGLSGSSYGALWTSGAFGSSTRVVTAQANNTVLSFRTGAAFAGTVALAAGVTSLTLNGENTAASSTTGYTMTAASTYDATVTLTGLGLDGTTPVAVKYSIGSAAGATDARTSGGGGLGNNSNAVVVEPSGGILSASASGTFNRSYTFVSKPLTKLSQFHASAGTSTTTIAGPIVLSGSDFVLFSGANSRACIIRFNGVVSGGASMFVGGNDTSPFSDATVEIGTGSDFSGWTGAALNTNNIRYGKSLPNANALVLWDSNPSGIYNVSGGDLTVRHSAYSFGVSDPTPQYLGPNNLTMTGPVSGSANWTSAPSTWSVDTGLTLELGFNFTGAGALVSTSGSLASGTGTLTLSGNNTGLTGLTVSTGNLRLNSAGSAGPAAATFTLASTGTLDNTSGGAITLTQGGANSLNANFTWGGSADLTFGAGALSWNAARTISFLNGRTGTLRFAGNIGALTSTLSLSVGGSPVGGSRSRLWLAGTNGMLATTSSVTAGYLRVSNSAGLGNALTTMWTVSSGAALELDGGISPPSARNATITGRGPDTDGSLRSVSGANIWNGSIVVPVQSLASPTRIQVDAGTFTLAASTYATIDPTTTGTPLQFTALGATAVLNQPRQLTSKVSDVVVNNGGVGTVVLSVANNHTGGTTVEGGKLRVTDVAATSTGTVQVNASATLESTVQSQFTTLRLGTTGSGARAVLAFAA